MNNAGAFGGCIADHLIDAEIVEAGRGVRTLTAEEMGYAYRTSVLKRGEHGLRLIMMCEIPSNALLAEEFLACPDMLIHQP